MRKVTFFSGIFILVMGMTAWGQNRTPLKVEKKVPVTGNENFDFLFTRSVMVGNVDSARFEASRSGSWTVGVGYGVPLGRSLLLKFEPRVTWTKYYYAPQNESSWFPSTDTSKTLIFEKIRASYIEVPISFKFKLARNLIDHYKLLLEAGFVGGARLGSSFKSRHFRGLDADNKGIGPKITTKVNHVPDVSNFRFGPFVRLGTNWLSLYGFYRMSDVFLSDRNATLPDGSTRPYPMFPRLEVGVTIAL